MHLRYLGFHRWRYEEDAEGYLCHRCYEYREGTEHHD